MADKKKIGILGGTFNPIHNGHLLIAENAYEEFGLDSVWIMPAHIPPHKPDRPILDDALRFEMVRLAVENVPYFVASDFELQSGRVSYTSETLTQLCHLYPENEYYFIMGADSLYTIEEWHCPAQIFSMVHILVAARDDAGIPELKKRADFLMDKYDAHISILSVPKLEISSTMIRKRAACHKSVRYFVPDSVAEFIKEHHLYSKELS